MVRIIEEFVPRLSDGRYPRTNRGTNPVTGITIHDTGNRGRGANALSHSRLQLRGGMPNNSWHATVDDKEVRVNYPDTARCWHAANATGNNNDYAIEICVNQGGNYAQAVLNAIEFAAIVAKRNPNARVKFVNQDLTFLHQHNFWSGKNCPQQIRSGRDGITWNNFKSRILAHLNDGNQPNPDPTPNPIPEEDIMASINDLKVVVNEALSNVRGDLDGLQRRLTLLSGLQFGFFNIEGGGGKYEDTVFAMEFDGTLTPISNRTWTIFRQTEEGAKVQVGFLGAAEAAGRTNGTYR